MLELERLRTNFPKRLKYSLGEKLSMQSLGAMSFTDKLWRRAKLLDAIFVIFRRWIGFF